MKSFTARLAVVAAMALSVVLGAAPVATAAPAACPDGVCATKVLGYSGQTQETYYFCGPAATRAALSVRIVSWNMPSQNTLAGQLGTDVNGTDHISIVTNVLRGYVGGWYENKYIPGNSATAAEIDRLRRDILLNVNNAFPIVANVLGTATAIGGASYSYPGGHYLTVVGYREGGNVAVIFDPANGRQYDMYATNLAHWIAVKGYSA